ncbi:MFS transporter [Azospirillum canadense]|uniref:MFS transporter n=1 Tax=Azospirillum canadense TaxID=403962 RepID=UPI002226A1A3|nr:MFS transporter [Azospirillum canadense]MCW2241664.1 DHA2 family multidrug resistance protein [Azospirillum canadense]
MTVASESAGARIPRPAAAGLPCRRPLAGVAAVLLGAFISTLNTRATTFGLADIRGGLGLGFDEGAWLTTAFSASQMVVAPSAAWLSLVVGTRRFLLWASAIFTVSSLLLPFTTDREVIIALQIVRGLSVGTFIPAALGFILRSLAPRWWIWGIAAYAFRFVFSQNVAASLESWYSETGHWQWIFWQNVVLTPVMALIILWAVPREGINRDLLRRTDWGAVMFAGLGFGLIYVGLDQANRLDWLNSGVVAGCLAGGLVLVAAFLVNEATVKHPLIHLPVLAQANVAVPALLIGIYGFGSQATAFVLPDYLTRIQGLRALQIGDVLNWIALPQFLIVPLVVLALRRIDSRLLLSIGFALIAIGSWMDTGLTHDWASGDFLPSQIVEAVGLAIGITSLITFAVSNITPPQAAAIAATIQTARLLGIEMGTAFIQTFLRVREQIYSNLIGQHLSSGSDIVDRIVTALSNIYGQRANNLGLENSQGIAAAGRFVQREAYVLAYIDGFWIVAWVLALAPLLVLLLRRPPPNPMTPPRIEL